MCKAADENVVLKMFCMCALKITNSMNIGVCLLFGMLDAQRTKVMVMLKLREKSRVGTFMHYRLPIEGTHTL